jgi:hypothetical protein
MRHHLAEAIVNVHTLRRVPWTCRWGRFGVAVEQVSRFESRVDDVFWACHNPVRSPEITPLRKGECETCREWMAASRFAD